MMRIASVFGLAYLRFAYAQEGEGEAPAEGDAADDVEFADTPLLSSIWQAISSKDNDAIDRLFDSSTFAVNARASDGRGPAFWAWEFQNAYALGSIIANGGDVESTDEDLSGSTAVSMCTENADCDRDKLLAEAKGLVEDIKKRKAEREKASDDLEDDDFDSDDSSSKDDDDEF